MITAKQYTDTYNQYRKMLREYSEIIFKSDEYRKTLTLHVRDYSDRELLITAVECIYSMTGDECFKKEVIDVIKRRSQ